MKKLILCLMISVFIVACKNQTINKAEPIIASACCDAEGTCSGDKYCTACKNCKYCKNCSKNGGSCGVCR